MKLKFLLSLACILIISSSLEASTWKLENCTGGFGSVTSQVPSLGSYIASLQFSDVTGEGKGKIQLDYKVSGESAPDSEVPVTCHFLTESKYAMHATDSKTAIVCETVKPIIAGLKLGFPFYLKGFGLPTNLNSYVQLEDGNMGAGSLITTNCEKVSKGI